MAWFAVGLTNGGEAGDAELAAKVFRGLVDQPG